MYLFLAFLFLFFSPLKGENLAVTENDPISIVDQVSVITGDVYIVEEDILVQGIQPISFKRSYVSQKGEGVWASIDCYHAWLLDAADIMVVKETKGSTLYYRVIREGKKGTNYKFEPLDMGDKAKGLTNTARGKLSGSTNLKNQQLYLSPNKKEFSITTADGTKRTYLLQQKESMKNFGMKLDVSSKYLLFKEEFSSGYKIIYEWPKKEKEVWQIRSCSADEQETYAWIRFYPKKGEKDRSDVDFGMETSDGRHFEYKYFNYNNRYQLREVSGDEKPTETFHYYTWKNRKVLNAITWPLNRSVQFTYYTPGENYNGTILQENDPICFRVKEVLSPVSEEGHLVVTRTFTYDLANKKTTVLDAYGTPTEYYWDDDLHLVEICRFTRPGVLYNTEKFIWGAMNSHDASNLLCKTLFDGNGSFIRSTRYFYDKFGNVSEERFYGDLSGEGRALSLDGEGFPNECSSEVYVKRYRHSEDGKHLLLEKSEDNQSKSEYSYLDNTCFIQEERHFDHNVLLRQKNYEYNSSRILTKKVSKDVVKGTILVTKITPKEKPNYIGFPEIVEKWYGTELEAKLLKKVSLQYGTGGRVCQKDVFDSTGRFRYKTQYKYEKGLLVRETNPFNQEAISKYDDVQNLIYYKDFGSRSELEMEYDCANRLCRTRERGERLKRDYTDRYNFLGQKISSCDEHSNETTYEYDSFGHLLETRIPGGEVVRYHYNATGCMISHTDAKNYETHTAYNAYDKPIQIIHPDGSQEHFRYYLDGNLHSYINQKGIETLYTYDSFGRVLSKEMSGLTETFTYDAFNCTSKTDRNGYTATFDYDGSGRKIAETFNEETIFYEYDPLGFPYKEYQGELVSITIHDAIGQIRETRKEDGKGACLYKVSYGYDLAGNQTSITKYIGGKEAKEVFDYDAFRRPIKHTDATGMVTTYSYSFIPHQKVTKDPLGLQTIKTYNSNGKLEKLEKRSASGLTLLLDSFIYDGNLNLIQKTSQIDGRQVTTGWRYGPLDRLEVLTEGLGSKEEKNIFYYYSPTGQVEKLIKPNGITLTSTYDDFDLLRSQFSSDNTIFYTYDYDNNGNLIQSTDQNTCERIVRIYDPKGRLKQETFLDHLTLTNTYDLQGRRNALTLPDSSYVLYNFDALHLKEVARYVGNRCLYKHEYLTHDLSSHVLEEKLPFGLGILTREHDVLERPVSVQSPFFSQKALRFDPVGNLLETLRAGKSLTYTYDDLYQLTSENGHIYRFDALYNRVMKDGFFTDVNSLNQSSDFVYNANGNPDFLQGKKLSYDALDRLIAIEGETDRICYSYDSLHRRLTKKTYCCLQGRLELVDAVYYLYDDQNEIGAFDASKKALELRILGLTSHAEIGSAIAIELDQKIYVPFHDLHGNVAALYSPSDQGGLESYSYTAFGEEEFSFPPSSNPWRFSSKRTDTETGLVYYGRRYYLPTLGRWLTQDPLSYDAGPNLYAFVLNSPLTHFDLYGLLEDSWFSRSMDKARDALAGVAHGTVDFAVNSVLWTGSAMHNLGSSMLRLDPSGREIASGYWAHSQQKGLNFINHTMTGMLGSLGANTSSGLYQGFRQGTTIGLDVATLAVGGYGIAKGGVGLINKAAPRLFKGVGKMSPFPSKSLGTLKDTAPQSAYNCALFEKYKVYLRSQMEKPYAVNSELRGLVDFSYKPHASIGSGSTAAAIRYEMMTGERVFDKLHSQKGRQMIVAFEKWLKNNPAARPGDQATAENIIKDLRNALGE